MKTRTHRWAPVAALLTAVAIGASACTGVTRTNGNMLEDSRIERVQPGVSSRIDVAQIFGSPTTVGTFDNQVWYYIGQREEQVAFFRPQILERRVIVVRFDANGTVQSVEMLTEADGIDVQIVQRETPTLGRQMTFLEQMLGNLGRYNVEQQQTLGSPL